MDISKPIQQKSIVEEVITRITNSLIREDYKSGDRIPSEFELSQSLGVGRNSIREALKMLTALGVLQIKRGDGTYVSDSISPSMLDPLLYGLILQRGTPFQLFELRLMYEVAGVELACEKATPTDIQKCQGIIDEMRNLIMTSKTSDDSLLDLDLAFHNAIYDACHNPLIERVGKTIFGLFMGSIARAMVVDLDRTISFHQEILDLIKNHEITRVRDAVKESLGVWGHILVNDTPQPMLKNRI